jgi:hypothetical protein
MTKLTPLDLVRVWLVALGQIVLLYFAIKARHVSMVFIMIGGGSIVAIFLWIAHDH